MAKCLTFSPHISDPNSLDFLRFFFAFSVFVSHFASTGYSVAWYPVPSLMGVNGFFIISGFLVMQSYCRSKNGWDYASKRAKRIVPAYVAVVILCALSFSCISALSFQNYFTSPLFFKYLGCNLFFLNFLQPVLPGVFTSNPYPVVNGPLWTIKIEIVLYILVPLFALCLKRVKPGYFLSGLYILSFLFYVSMTYLYAETGNELFKLLRRQAVGQLRFFISGIILLFYFDFIIKKHIQWFLPISLIIFILCFYTNYWMVGLLLPIAYAVIIISFAYYFKKPAYIARYGDFSYGFYLYHFPVIQLMIHLGYFRGEPVLLFLACFLITLGCSALSWHLLEKKALRRTKNVWTQF
jgi:peptidoglycan/LPS O-acetylase OafA/YrhL